MTSASQAAGRAWEDKAARYLTQSGLEIIDRGYACRAGEIDLVCRDESTLVVVEVRARKSGSHGSATESVDWRKRAKIIRATRHYLMRHPHLYSCPLRFDIIAFDAIEKPEPALNWTKNAFDGS